MHSLKILGTKAPNLKQDGVNLKVKRILVVCLLERGMLSVLDPHSITLIYKYKKMHIVTIPRQIVTKKWLSIQRTLNHNKTILLKNLKKNKSDWNEVAVGSLTSDGYNSIVGIHPWFPNIQKVGRLYFFNFKILTYF